MFCNQCGAPIQPDYNLCPKCGLPVARGAAPPPAQAQSRLARHLRTLGIFWMIVGAFWLIRPALLMTLSRTMPFMIGTGGFFGHTFVPPFLFMFGSLFLLVAAGGIFVGWGLMERQSWARTAAIVLGILVIFHPPFGTALGIYTLWVLLANDAAREYDRISHAG